MCFNDLKLDITITTVPRMMSVNLVFHKLSEIFFPFVEFQQRKKVFAF